MIFDNDADSNATIDTLLYRIESPVDIDSNFNSYQTPIESGVWDVNIELRYRLICTPGSCGNYCSQDVHCPSFADVCGLACNSTDASCSTYGACVVSNYIRILFWVSCFSIW